MRVTLFLCLVLFALPLHAETEATLKLAGVVDSNPGRLLLTGADPSFATRLTADLNHRSYVGEQGEILADLLALGTLFPTRFEYSSLALSGGVQGQAWLGERFFVGGGPQMRLRFEHPESCASDSCASRLDYRLFSLAAMGGVSLGPAFLSLNVAQRFFIFPPESGLGWMGPQVGAGVRFRLLTGLSLGVHWQSGWRFFQQQALTLDAARALPVLGEELRQDLEHEGGASLRYAHSRWSLALRYTGSRVHSNSLGRSHSRHAIEPVFTAIPVGDLLVRASARLLRTHFESIGLPDPLWDLDDDSRNRVSVVVEHPVMDDQLFVEAGWLLHLQGSSDDERGYRRHVAHLGLSWRIGGEE